MIKNFLPKSLFVRFIFIIMVPTIMAQAIATYIFYNRHWSNVSDYMINGLVGEISTIINLKEKTYIEDIVTSFASHEMLYLNISKSTKNDFKIKPIPSSLQDLYNELTDNIIYPVSVGYSPNENVVLIDIELPSEVLNFIVPKKRLENPTTYIFIIWMTGTSAFFFVLSLIFSKNQIRPIIKLARVAEKFGKGIAIKDFKPEGALEVRKAGIAFLKMKERIEKQISYRMEFLSGVSHDLRTPLTRMKLELAMCKDTIAKEIEEDVSEMEKMINSYLDFARGEGTEKSDLVFINELLENIVANYIKQRKKIKFSFDKKIQIFLKTQAITRAICNILDNSFKFATKVCICGQQEEENYTIMIDDNGPGIPEDERENVFRPFYRIEGSRNNNTGGIGLGLSIVRDLISNHGGSITLDDSKILKGLRVIIKLPI